MALNNVCYVDGESFASAVEAASYPASLADAEGYNMGLQLLFLENHLAVMASDSRIGLVTKIPCEYGSASIYGEESEADDMKDEYATVHSAEAFLAGLKFFKKSDAVTIECYTEDKIIAIESDKRRYEIATKGNARNFIDLLDLVDWEPMCSFIPDLDALADAKKLTGGTAKKQNKWLLKLKYANPAQIEASICELISIDWRTTEIGEPKAVMRFEADWLSEPADKNADLIHLDYVYANQMARTAKIISEATGDPVEFKIGHESVLPVFSEIGDHSMILSAARRII